MYLYDYAANANARLKFQTFLPQANTIKCVENFAFVATQRATQEWYEWQ